jgi:anti-sigma B factor antagonist
VLTTKSNLSALSISVSNSEGETRVSLYGRLSFDNSPEVRDRLLAILGRRNLPALTIDLAELTYMDCSGVATLVESLKIARTRNTLLLFTGLRDRPRYFLEVTSLLYHFQTSGRTDGSFESKAL